MPPPSETPRKNKDEERRKFRGALDEVGVNLPYDPVEVEGSDVVRIERHKGDKKEDEEEEIRESLEHPHPDTPQETVDDLDL